MLIDVARAYFHAQATRAVYVRLPDEDEGANCNERPLCGRLRLSIYGTRDAAHSWELEYTRFMDDTGFSQGEHARVSSFAQPG